MATGAPGSRRSRSRRAGPDGPTPGSPADEAREADPESVARGIVLRRLTAAPRTRAQLEGDLAARGVPGDVAERVLDRFTEVGLVDDAAFAETWVRCRHATRGLSRRALAQELRQKGIEDEVAREAVAEIDSDDERAAAAALVARRLRATRGLPRQARVRRLAGTLARKGYPSGLALAVVREALAAEGSGGDGAGLDADDLIDSDAADGLVYRSLTGHHPGRNLASTRDNPHPRAR